MHDFSYHRPKSLDNVASLLGTRDDPLLLAGGQTMVPTLKQRLAAPSDVIDLAEVSGLTGIEATGNGLKIGAMTCHADVASSAAVQSSIPALATLAGGIGDMHVRNLGTLGGSIANSDPAADYPAAVLGLGATVHTTGGDIQADDFFTAMFETALGDGDVITAVSFPASDMAAYAKFDHPASRYALVGVFVAKGPSGVRVAVTGAGPYVYRQTDMEAALSAVFSAGALADLTVSPDGLNTDLYGGPEYRASLIKVMAIRAVETALAGAS
jgi:aerobic carbon-monoxide dehydrogenase medium subunit